ncbi:hypothetical protein TCAL_07826 [Tigriopus californicus]|uniref:Golgin-45 n=1 Tax=Tigriopus californicus TaxID=6832 RepID=A0A553NQ84_TIGCA|nr:hypothetical protein TCAL_07826 [Tigriopus californicus]
MWNLVMGAVFSSDEEDNEESGTSSMEPSNPKAGLLNRGQVATTGRDQPRLPSPTRECGDGKEAEQSVAGVPLAKTHECSSSLRDKRIRLPQTNIRLAKLPPISDDQVTMDPIQPTSPLVPIYVGGAHRTITPSSSSFRKDKEPKFVPYEPYKASVTPLVSKPKRAKKKSLNSSLAESVRAVSEEPVSPGSPESIPPHPMSPVPCSSPTYVDPHRPDDALANEMLLERIAKLERDLAESEKQLKIQTQVNSEVGHPVPCSSPTYVDPHRPDDALANEMLLERIAKLERDLAESEKQLKIQTQVNSEVKKLLVASVGEDIEAQVDYLTQDKARLSADIHQYTSKISRDFEEKEKLFVESNLWKSKFLASSVIVDELARWKAGLIHHSDEYNHGVRVLLQEHALLWDSLMKTYGLLSRLKTAFDPLKKPPTPPECVSLNGLADYSLKCAQELRERLIGQNDLKTEDLNGEPLMPKQLNTLGEEKLKEILAKPLAYGASDYSEVASLAVTGCARPHLRKLGDQLVTPTGFKCCTHCQGTVHNV